MRRLLPLFAIALFVVGCENVQAPAELTLQTRSALDVLPADANVVGMFNAEEARDSNAFETFTDGGLSMRRMGGEGTARFDDFLAATGFDPDEDLHRMYFAATGDPGGDSAPAFVVYADYDRDRLDEYVGSQPDLELERTTYADAPVYLTAQHGREMAFALVNDDMIVGGDRAEVYAMLDRLASGTKGLSADAAMMALIRNASHPDDMWIAMRDLPGDNGSVGESTFGQAGQLMQDVVVSAGFEDDGVAFQVRGVTRPGASTSDAADLVRGAVSAMKMSAKSDRAALDALDRVDVREVRDGVTIEGFVDQKVIRSMKAHDDA
ncbi:MAG: hypothetical protein ABJF88_03505 [Rhodothermales bacterium]